MVAYMLFLNDIVDETFLLSKETFGSVKMPNAGGFYDADYRGSAKKHSGIRSPAWRTARTR